MIDHNLYDHIIAQYALNLGSIHGVNHWRRVEALGLYLAKHTNADTSVISHFAYIHDAKRLNELYDPDHGKRAALFCDDLSKIGLLSLSLKHLNQLEKACEIHSYHPPRPKDITIATCLDADKLDLIRLGVTPIIEFLFTKEAKRIAVKGIDAIDHIANSRYKT